MDHRWKTLTTTLGHMSSWLARGPSRESESQARLRAVVARLPSAVWSTDAGLRVVSYLGGALPHLQLDSATFVGRGLGDVLGAGGAGAVEAHLRARAGDTAEFELFWRGRLFTGTAQPWPAERPGTGTLGVILDVTDRRQVEEQLRHAVMHDAVTGLPNRTLFLDRVRQAMGRAWRNPDHAFGILVLDLDRFKSVNDSLGHHAGDVFLAAVARRLTPCVRPQDMLAHLGGDEFSVLVDDLDEPSDLLRVAERMRGALALPLTVRDQEIFTSATIGIAPGSRAYREPEPLLRDAHTAMHRAKLQGPGAFQIFDEAMHARAVGRLRLETELRRGLDRGELRLHYQPIVSLRSGELAAFEGLVRWEHPGRGLLVPDDFLPVAEETGLILPLGRWVLQEGCRQMRLWRRTRGDAPLPVMSLNLSGRQLAESDLVAEVDRALQTEGLAGRELDLEVTEKVIMQDADSTRGCLAGLRAMDLGVSIDDFGTGHSSLSHLDRLPVDTLKIDRSFLDVRTGHPRKAEIVRTIVTLGHSLGLEVIAEGIETSAQLLALREMGCDHGQGYLFSPPVDASTAEAMLVA
ncbi:MAG TPA: EAL domain-containing protein [Vicinamibacteria bacterium]|nr:EAL domain-containing protein [Vicinamibacteria bacterium]